MTTGREHRGLPFGMLLCLEAFATLLLEKARERHPEGWVGSGTAALTLISITTATVFALRYVRMRGYGDRLGLAVKQTAVIVGATILACLSGAWPEPRAAALLAGIGLASTLIK